MSLVPYKVTAIKKTDPTGNNVLPMASVAIVKSGGGYAQLWDDEAGTIPRGNPFQVDANGERQVWLNGGEYNVSVAGGQSWEIRLLNVGDAVLRQEIGDFASTLYFNSVSEMVGLPASSPIKYAVVRSYMGAGNGGGGIFKFNPYGTVNDRGWSISRASGGTWERLTGDRTIEDYGYSSGDLTIGQIRAAVASGNIDRLDINFEPDAFVSDFLAANIADTSGLRINGANIRKNLPNQKIYAAIPKEFPINIPFRAWIDGGRVGHDYDITQHDAIKNGTAAVTYYIDPINGSISNDGLTELTPMKDLYGVFLAEQSSGLSPRSVGVLAKGGFYRRTRGWMDSPIKPFYDLTIRSWDGELVEMWEAVSDLTYTPIGNNCYTATRSGSVMVVDRANKNSEWDYYVYKKMSTQAECIDVAGSFHFDSDTNIITVHCIDDRVPDSDLMVTLSSGHLIDLDGESSFDIYLENVAFYGGGSAAPFANRNVNNNINVYLNKCLARYSSSNGFTLRGVKYAILNECEASYTGADGFNYHSSYSDPTAERCDAIEINCVARYCGNPAFSDSSNRNASTAHDSCNIARFGTVGYKTYGPVIIDVNDVKSYNFYCRAGMSIGTADNSDYVFSSVSSQFDGTTGWLDNCQTMGGSSYGLMSGSGALVHIRDCYLHPNIYGASAIREYTGGDVF